MRRSICPVGHLRDFSRIKLHNIKYLAEVDLPRLHIHYVLFGSKCYLSNYLKRMITLLLLHHSLAMSTLPPEYDEHF